MGALKRRMAKIDALQKRHAALALPVAVIKKFGDDQGGQLAALIAYYGFFSLFPLLLVFVTVLGFTVGTQSHFEQQVVHSVLGRFPVIGDQLRVHALKGSGLALAVGIVGAVAGGLGVVQAGQSAMDQIWGVPRTRRPNFVIARLRAGGLLVLLGTAVVVSTLLAGIATGGSHEMALRVAGIALSTAVNIALFVAAFRLLTVARVRLVDLIPGAVVAAVAWEILQAVGAYYVGHQLKGASQTYGVFALVIGLLSWLYIQAQITLLAAEINVVRARRLWPRSLFGDTTMADERTLRELAQVEERRPDEDVAVTFKS